MSKFKNVFPAKDGVKKSLPSRGAWIEIEVVDVHCRKVYTDESGLIAGVYIRLTPVMDEWRIPEWLLVQ